MRYFMTIIPSPDYEAGKPVPQGIMDAMGPYIEKTIATGALISTAGLKRSSSGVRLTGHGGRVAIVDGACRRAVVFDGGDGTLLAGESLPARAVAPLPASQTFLVLSSADGGASFTRLSAE